MKTNYSYKQQSTAQKIEQLNAKNMNILNDITNQYLAIESTFAKSDNDQMTGMLEQLQNEWKAVKQLAAFHSTLLKMLKSAAIDIDTVQEHYAAGRVSGTD